MIRLVVLDRDGVINHDSDSFIKSADEWLPIDGSAEAIGRLTNAGYTVAVATNQSGIGRQLLSDSDLVEIHNKMCQHIENAGGHIDKIVFCPHLPDAGCDCRKPRPGLLLQLQDYYGIDLHDIPVIGDSERDLRAAQAVGARPVLVLTGNGKKTLASLELSGEAMETFENLASAVDALLLESSQEPRA
jgi:D-glycero-D-manno-heptose 1,7-bisphosphate phosphatase